MIPSGYTEQKACCGCKHSWQAGFRALLQRYCIRGELVPPQFLDRQGNHKDWGIDEKEWRAWQASRVVSLLGICPRYEES